MKIKFIFLFIIVLITNLSCKKYRKIDLNTGPCLPLTLITKVTGSLRMEADGSLQALNKIFIYNSSNSLVRIKDGSKSFDVSYDNIYTFKLQYADSAGTVPKRRVIDVLAIESTFRPSAEEESIYEGDKLVSKSSIKYSYVGDNNTEITYTSSTGATLVERYTFKDRNISSFDNGKGTIYTYKYGNKINPFANWLLMYRMGPTDFFSANEVLEIEENTNGLRKISRNTYTYNKEGYPITLKTINSSGITTQDVKFEYGSFSYGCY